METSNLPRRGDFDHQVLVGAFDPVIEDGAPQASYFGLVLEGSWPYAVMRDDTGGLWAMHRNVQGRTTRGIVVQRGDATGLRAVPEGFAWMSGGMVRRALDGDHDTYRGVQYPEGPSFEFDLGPTCRWTENDGRATVLDLAGTRLGPGFHVYTPWRGGGVYYTSLAYRAEGEVLGRPAEGFVFFDQSYLGHGDYWNESRVWSRLQGAWAVFANVYEDGVVEHGHLGVGADDFVFALVTDADGVVTRERTNVAAKVDWGDGGYAQRVTYDIAGREEWVFEKADDGSMVDASAARPGWKGQIGTIRRSGDARRPVRAIGWQEVFPDRV